MTELHTLIRDALDKEDRALPAETIYALQHARVTALASLKPASRFAWLKPLWAVTPAIFVLAIASRLPDHVTHGTPANLMASTASDATLDELELMQSDADPELLRQMDMLIWMSEHERVADNTP